MENDNQNLTLKDRTIVLSPKMYKAAVVSLGVGAVLFIASCGYSIYSLLNYKNNQAAINEMQKTNEMQQEQLLTLSKKAVSLDEELQNLTLLESELRIQAGIQPAKDVAEKKDAEVAAAAAEAIANAPDLDSNASEDNNLSNEHNGQGGPISELQFGDVEEALNMLAVNLKTRRESLIEVQDILKRQRDQIDVLVSIQGSRKGDNIVVNTPVFKSTSFSATPSIWPATGVVSSPYGLRGDGGEFHPGIDIANDIGTPIVATADGTVDYAGWNDGGYGNMVDIVHENNIMTRYGHASKVLVTKGQTVKRGQVIALMGSTGRSTGPHVHYEIHVNGEKVNPVSYL
ncbi:MAG: M23 family metallopeptidase [Selenomonadaceae bacterium]|nr:M23 family metallopeptidase [Selenomonadaceae bacterium]